MGNLIDEGGLVIGLDVCWEFEIGNYMYDEIFVFFEVVGKVFIYLEKV